MRSACILSGSSHPVLVKDICNLLSTPVGKSTLNKFSNKETNVMIDETVRGVDCYIVQSPKGSVNDQFMELLIMISACKTASAKSITAVIPCFPYARQSETLYRREPSNQRDFKREMRKKTMDSQLSSPIDGGINNSDLVKGHRPRLSSISFSQSNSNIHELLPPLVPESGSNTGYKHWNARPGVLICQLIEAAGCDHVITMDLHDPQFQGYFNIPVDNLLSAPLIVKYIKEKIDYKNAVIVSPDAGGAKRASNIADKLNLDFALIHKERAHEGPHGTDGFLVGDVADRIAIIIDDVVDTAETICLASSILKEKGATQIIAIITHAILSGSAIDRIKESPLSRVIVSNTLPQQENMARCDKIEIMEITTLFSEAIRRIHNGESVSILRHAVPY